MRHVKTDYLIIGSGIAGLSTALWSKSHGQVTVLSKGNSETCNTALAQGGIAAAVASGDSPEIHFNDTLFAGAGICERDTVKILTLEAPDAIKNLLAWGVNFDRDISGGLSLAREGAHSLARVLHHGDDTGAEILNCLEQRARDSDIQISTDSLAVELTVAKGRCTGAIAFSQGEYIHFAARAVVLATGGCGQVYSHTTNSFASTGDGFALAWRSGAVLRDMEFVQFHPTALNFGRNPLSLVSEAVRGEGAVLVDSRGKRFMQNYHPMADLAPRDVVSRAIVNEQAQGQEIFLDASSIVSFRTRFPNIFMRLKAAGIDPASDPIPVTPAAHFMVGGIKTDSYGRTSIPGLYACGEASSTGIHGANRLASNSLLEGVVFGRRIALALAAEIHTSDYLPPAPVPVKTLGLTDPRLLRLQKLMWTKVGIIRHGEELAQAQQELNALWSEVGPGEFELKSLLEVAMLITTSALDRHESRGSHYRSDYPAVNRNSQQFHTNSRRYTA